MARRRFKIWTPALPEFVEGKAHVFSSPSPNKRSQQARLRTRALACRLSRHLPVCASAPDVWL